MEIVLGILIPFLGTTIGSAMVFLMGNKLNTKHFILKKFCTKNIYT